MDPRDFQDSDGNDRGWQNLVGNAITDDLTADSICILAYCEYEQNGASDPR